MIMTTRMIVVGLFLLLAACGPVPDSIKTTPPASEASTFSPEAASSPTPSTPLSIWRPTPGTTWQWQLVPPLDGSVNAQVFDIDLFENDASVIARLHASGVKVICYTSVGSLEDWRPDAGKFPDEVVGRDYPGWSGEKYLDIRQIDKLGPLMLARLDLCKQKGFDGVEPDNMDNYNSETGFPITYEDQLKYDRWLAVQAHARGLSIGMKNDGDQVADLVNDFDWALTEDCFYQGWCDQMKPFIQQGKAVFAAEYSDTGIRLDGFCPQAMEMGFSAILKNRDLDAFRKACL